MKQKLMKVVKILSNRMGMFALAIAAMFYMITLRLFDLQIVNGSDFVNQLNITSYRSVALPPARGQIFDRLGRPLAVNETIYDIMIDPARIPPGEGMNAVAKALVGLFDAHGENLADTFPINIEPLYEGHYYGDGVYLSEGYVFSFGFGGNERREYNWKRDMTIGQGDNPVEAFEYLRLIFGVDSNLSHLEARAIVAIRSAVFMNRFRQSEPVLVASNVSFPTVVRISEDSDSFQAVFVSADSVRRYPGGRYVSNIVGHMGRITPQQLSAMQHLGYTAEDRVGVSGLEASFELSLRGVAGEQLVEVGPLGRPVSFLEPTLPVPGDMLFTTIDLELQQTSYEILRGWLAQTIISKMTSPEADEFISHEMFFASMVRSNNIPVSAIMDYSNRGPRVNAIRSFLLANYPEPEGYLHGEGEAGSYDELRYYHNEETLRALFVQAMQDAAFGATHMLLAMEELGILEDDGFVGALLSGQQTPHQVILEKLRQNIISPQMTGLDPSTGSVVVVEVATGDVLVAVGYPTFDNNRLSGPGSAEYIARLNADTTTSPWINRPFREARAPGSTFKPITAVLGMEAGIIGPNTLIYDGVVFTSAGQPYSRNWSPHSFGWIDVGVALSASINYFFSEIGWRLGNAPDATQHISTMAFIRYMTEFGLNDRTGVEIDEHRDSFPEDMLVVSSPQFKEFMTRQVNPDAGALQYGWFDGDIARTAYGQSANNYTAASMAKVYAILAGNGVRRQMSLMRHITDHQGNLRHAFEPVVEGVVSASRETFDVVNHGLLMVTEHHTGTATSMFNGFDIRVAGKTGTAEQITGRPSHTSFGGFAPFEDPQIAVYVVVPFSDTSTISSTATQVARDVIGAFFRLEHEPQRPAPTGVLLP